MQGASAILRRSRCSPLTETALVLSCLLFIPEARGEPPAIVLFGGGWGPEGNQASIEMHVVALARALAPFDLLLLFASGESTRRTVQVAAERPDAATDLLGRIFDRTDALHVEYRRPEARSDGPATRAALLDALAARRRRPAIIVFGVGHGVPQDNERPATLELWGVEEKLDVRELALHLDGLEAAGPIAFVLGQCHGGAFTAITYAGADAARGAATPARCVLAAVPADRAAAGCTPDVDDPSARAYMALVAEALSSPEHADFDGDGKVALAEAHAHARIHDGTVDVPVSSSETWLADVLGADAPDPAALDLQDLLRDAARSEEAVITRLLPKGLWHLGYAAVKKRAGAVKEHIERLDQPLDRLIDERDRVRRKLVDKLLLEFPELANPYHRRAREMLAKDAEQVVAFLRRQADLERFEKLGKELRTKDEEILALERQAARLERWQRAVQRLANERALRKKKDPGSIRTLDAILGCEALTLR